MSTSAILVDEIRLPDGVSEVIKLKPDGTYEEIITDKQEKTFVHTGTWENFKDTKHLPANHATEPHVLIKQWIDTHEVHVGKHPARVEKIDNVRSLNRFKEKQE